MKRLLFLNMFLWSGIQCHGQLADNYQLLSCTPDNERQLVQRLKKQTRTHWHELKGFDNYDEIGELYKSRSQYLEDQIENRRFIFSDTLQQGIDSIFYHLIVTNRLGEGPRDVFIGKTHQVNALCYGEGSFMITTGLLSRVKTVDQLAFIMSHELAHYSLNHIRDKTIQLVSNRGIKRADREIRNILLGKSTLEGLEMLKAWNYQLSKFSRSQEQQADSLGLVFMTKSGYSQKASLEVIDILANADEPVLHLGDMLFDEFKFSKFPFQDHWLRQRLNIYKKNSDKSFIYDRDSIKTHPEFKVRSENLEVLLSSSNLANNSESVDSLAKIAWFESVDGAVKNNQFDQALHLALQLKSVYPRNRYLVSTIAKLLVLLYEARENRLFQYFVNPYTSHYSDELRLINNFLYNIDKYEMMELAFYFMNKKGNFNVEEEEHYHLLWKISGITKRPKFQQKVKSSYAQNFPEGRFLSLMK